MRGTAVCCACTYSMLLMQRAAECMCVHVCWGWWPCSLRMSCVHPAVPPPPLQVNPKHLSTLERYFFRYGRAYNAEQAAAADVVAAVPARVLPPSVKALGSSDGSETPRA